MASVLTPVGSAAAHAAPDPQYADEAAAVAVGADSEPAPYTAFPPAGMHDSGRPVRADGRTQALPAADATPTSDTVVISDTVQTNTFTAITAGDAHTCALRTNGQAECWGYNTGGQATPPSGTYTTITAGDAHTCALRTNGQAECWGYNNDGQATPPSGTYTTITAGSWHTCALRTNGQAECWGDNEYGQATPPSGTYTTITAGLWHTCALRTNGQAECWGYNTGGQATPPSGTYTTITAGRWHTCALRTGGQAECWGYNTGGQATPPSGTYTTITAGGHTCALRTGGQAECWGYNEYGQATPPSGTYTTITAGADHTCALRTGGQVACWGDNAFGEATPPGQATVPGAPRNLSVVPGDRSLVVSWSPPASDGGAPITGWWVCKAANNSSGCTPNVDRSADADSNSVTLKGLFNGTSYRVSVWAVNRHGRGESAITHAAPVGPASVPSHVPGVTVNAGVQSVELSWDPPESDGGSPVTGYAVSWSGGSDSGQVTVTGTSYTIAGLTADTTYSISIRAVNRHGQSTVPNTFSATPRGPTTTVPDTPRNLSVVPGDRSLAVSWSPPVSDGGAPITGYAVAWSGSAGSGQITVTGTRYNITGLVNGSSYRVSVEATNRHGRGATESALGTPASTRTPTASLRQSNVDAVVDGKCSGSCTWQEVSVSGFAPGPHRVKCYSHNTASRRPVEYQTSERYYVQVGSDGTGSNLRVCYNGYYRGVATDSADVYVTVGGHSSNTIALERPAVARPGKVTGITAVPGVRQLTVKWDAPHGSSTSIVDYIVYYFESSKLGCADCGPTPSVVTTSRQVTITGLTAGREYTVSVRARNSAGIGPLPDYATATPTSEIGKPSVPRNVRWREVGSGGDRLDLLFIWDPPTSDGGSPIVGYDVSVTQHYRQAVDDGVEEFEESFEGSTNGVNTSIKMPVLNRCGKLFVNVSARNSAGHETTARRMIGQLLPSGQRNAKPQTPTDFYYEPVEGTDGRVKLSWTGTSDPVLSSCTSYAIQWSHGVFKQDGRRYSPNERAARGFQVQTNNSTTITPKFLLSTDGVGVLKGGGLHTGRKYFVKLTAQHSNGRHSDVANLADMILLDRPKFGETPIKLEDAFLWFLDDPDAVVNWEKVSVWPSSAAVEYDLDWRYRDIKADGDLSTKTLDEISQILAGSVAKPGDVQGDSKPQPHPHLPEIQFYPNEHKLFDYRPGKKQEKTDWDGADTSPYYYRIKDHDTGRLLEVRVRAQVNGHRGPWSDWHSHPGHRVALACEFLKGLRSIEFVFNVLELVDAALWIVAGAAIVVGVVASVATGGATAFAGTAFATGLRTVAWQTVKKAAVALAKHIVKKEVLKSFVTTLLKNLLVDQALELGFDVLELVFGCIGRALGDSVDLPKFAQATLISVANESNDFSSEQIQRLGELLSQRLGKLWK